MLKLDDFLAQSQSTTIEAIQAENARPDYSDGFWHPVTDKAGACTVIGRFMPTPPGEKSPYVVRYRHKFKGPGGQYYNEFSLTTIGQKDPVGLANSKAWAAGDKDTAKSRSRKKRGIVNFLIIKAPLEPENEGKIVQWQYPGQIQDKIDAAMKPKEGFEDEAINPFDLMKTGADFVLDISIKGEHRNYDDSRFKARGALFDGDVAKMKAVLEGKELPSLSQHMDPKHFKSFEVLEARFNEVMNGDAQPNRKASDDIDDQARREPKSAMEESRAAEPAAQRAAVADVGGSGEVEDEDEYFRSLLNK